MTQTLNQRPTSTPFLEQMGEWLYPAYEKLRQYPNETIFLLDSKGTVNVCALIGNLPKDESWKAQRFNDFRIIRLEKLKSASALVLWKPPRKDPIAGLVSYLVAYGGGLGPDVWDGEMTVQAENIREAITIAERRINDSGAVIFSIEQS